MEGEEPASSCGNVIQRHSVQLYPHDEELLPRAAPEDGLGVVLDQLLASSVMPGFSFAGSGTAAGGFSQA